jgi:hypothetical protein
MSTISTQYGQWIGQYDWSHIVTIRRHFKLSEIYAQGLCQNIVKKSKDVSRLFYSLENDRQDNMNHLHLLIEANDTKLSRSKLAHLAGFGNNPKAISSLQDVESKEAVAMYVTKYIGKPDVYHGFEDQRFYE